MIRTACLLFVASTTCLTASDAVSVDLWDGSRLVGTMSPREFPFVRDDGTRVRLTTADVVELACDEGRELFTVHVSDGVRRGDVLMDSLTVTGVFGTVDVPFREVSRVRFVRPDSGLIAHYPFDGDLEDATGNGNHGVGHDDVSFVEGRVGKAARFDGEGDYVSIEPRSDVSEVEDFTVSAWVHVDSWKTQQGGLADRQYVFDGYSIPARGVLNGPGVGLMCDGPASNEAIETYVCASRQSYRGYRPRTSLRGRWRLLTFTRSARGDFTYVDGEVIAKSPSFGTERSPDGPLDMRHPWFVGTFAANDPAYYGGRFRYDFKGLVDDLRIYGRALNDLEVRELARSGK